MLAEVGAGGAGELVDGMSEKLKPCPFCGGEAIPLHNKLWNVTAVTCKRCGAMGPTWTSSALSELIDVWNKRIFIKSPGDFLAVYFVCSACGYEVFGWKRPNYCPECGAKVVE